MPEPSWSRIGTTTVKDTATVELNTGEVKECGKTDLFVEVWEVENDSRSSENYIACTPQAGIWPGIAYSDGWDEMINSATTMTQDWTANRTGGYEITDWGPTEPKTGSLNWSMSASYGVGGAQGGVSASYDVPYISREIDSEPDETVAHSYSYPTGWNPLEQTAKSNFVEIESLGEGWIDDGGHFDTMVKVDLDHEVRDRNKNVYPSASTSVYCSRYEL